MCSSFWVEQANVEDASQVFLLVNASEHVQPLSLKSIKLSYENFLVARSFSKDKDGGKSQFAETIAGCCALFEVSDVFLELRSFVVDERHFGHGIAKRLMVRAIHLARQRKKNIFCFSRRNAFFGKFGFSIVTRDGLDVNPDLDPRYALERREAGLKIYLYKT